MSSIRRLPSGRWQASVYLPDGRRTTRTNALKSAVRTWATEQESKIARGELRDPKYARLTVREWLDRYADARVVEPETERGDNASRSRVLAAFGDRPLVALTRLEVQSWVKHLESVGVGRAAIRRNYNYLAAALNAAVAEGVLSATPCRRISLPAMPPSPPRWYSLAEVDALVSQLREPHATMTLLMCFDALRWGEAAGLRVRDVDWLRSRLRVEGTLTQQGRWKPYPKTSRSRRSELPIPRGIVVRMAKLVEKRRGDPDALIFVTPRKSRPLNGPNWGRVWFAAIERAGIRRETPHVCRHTGISWQVQAGIDLYRVQHFAGHESSKTTEKYAHLAPDRYDPVPDAWSKLGDIETVITPVVEIES